MKIGLVMMMPATVTSTSGKIMKQDNDACKKTDHTELDIWKLSEPYTCQILFRKFSW